MLPILKRDYISPETGQVFEVQTIGDSTHVLRNGWGVHVGQTSGDFREFVTRLLADAKELVRLENEVQAQRINMHVCIRDLQRAELASVRHTAHNALLDAARAMVRAEDALATARGENFLP